MPFFYCCHIRNEQITFHLMTFFFLLLACISRALNSLVNFHIDRLWWQSFWRLDQSGPLFMAVMFAFIEEMRGSTHFSSSHNSFSTLGEWDWHDQCSSVSHLWIRRHFIFQTLLQHPSHETANVSIVVKFKTWKACLINNGYILMTFHCIWTTLHVSCVCEWVK